jgi:mono/diheme cytochrome c family protein
MISLRPFLPWFALVAFGVAAGNADPAASHPIAWDAMKKVVVAKPDDGVAEFEFKATNTSARAVTINSARPSCGCTVVDLPASPWVLAPGASGVLRATVDFAGKEGVLTKSVAVDSSAGEQTLFLQVDIPPADETGRLRNRALAGTNRQAVFLGECASCHVMPGIDKQGEALFTSTCGVCHLSAHRASMVPDLFTARTHRDAAWWRTWIDDGKDGTLMPAFAAKNGGPLSNEQIDSLVEFALSHLPTEPQKN